MSFRKRVVLTFNVVLVIGAILACASILVHTSEFTGLWSWKRNTDPGAVYVLTEGLLTDVSIPLNQNPIEITGLYADGLRLYLRVANLPDDILPSACRLACGDISWSPYVALDEKTTAYFSGRRDGSRLLVYNKFDQDDDMSSNHYFMKIGKKIKSAPFTYLVQDPTYTLPGYETGGLTVREITCARTSFLLQCEADFLDRTRDIRFICGDLQVQFGPEMRSNGMAGEYRYLIPGRVAPGADGVLVILDRLLQKRSIDIYFNGDMSDR